MTSTQLQFDLGKQRKIAEQFLEFHEANPDVFFELEKLAQMLIRRGRHKLSIGLLFEVLRWEFYMNTEDPNSEFKLNNNYRSHYARLLIERHPEFEAAIETRELRSA